MVTQLQGSSQHPIKTRAIAGASRCIIGVSSAASFGSSPPLCHASPGLRLLPSQIQICHAMARTLVIPAVPVVPFSACRMPSFGAMAGPRSFESVHHCFVSKMSAEQLRLSQWQSYWPTARNICNGYILSHHSQEMEHTLVYNGVYIYTYIYIHIYLFVYYLLLYLFTYVFIYLFIYLLVIYVFIHSFVYSFIDRYIYIYSIPQNDKIYGK